MKQGNVAGRLHRHCTHHRDLSTVSATTHGRRGARYGGWTDSARGGADCCSLLGVSVALRDKLGLDHIRDQVVLVAHELHHFGRGGDGVRGSLGGVAPLACHHKSRQADRDQSCREQTLSHCQRLCFKRTVGIQTSV